MADDEIPEVAVEAVPAKPQDPLIGRKLKGTYRLEKKVGEGGMGNVYLAVQDPLDRQVAVKLLKPSESNPEGEHYFLREVRAINMLRHPNIIGIVDFGKEPDGSLYLVMEFLPGKTLKRVIRKEFPLTPARICNICIQILAALESAHSKGIVHCDLKPANIMLEEIAGEDDFVKVLDFGIAKVKEPGLEAGPYTQAGNIVGTFDYMSPEQIMRRDLDGRADLWSLGVIMYEMLTRKRIFHDKDAVSIIGRVMQMPIKPPSEVLGDDSIPKVLEDIVLKAMERNSEKRFKDAAEMREVLKAAKSLLEGHAASQATGRMQLPSSDSMIHSQAGMSQSLAGSGLVRDQSGNLLPGMEGQTGRTGLSAFYTRSGLGQSQRLMTGLAAGTSVLDQTFSIDELQDSLLGERRKVAVLAIQQRSRGKKGLDPEELARRSKIELRLIKEVIEAYEGEVDSHLGGTFTILFGAKKAKVGDNIRAVECGLELRNRFLQLEHGSQHLGIGLAYGEVYLASRKGGNAFGEAIDSAVEIARGLKDARVFASEELMEVTRARVDFDAVRPISGEPAAEVLRVRAEQPKEEPVLEKVDDIYVPRPALFEDLMRAAADAKTGRGGGVGIIGDVGAGKTVLLKRFAENLAQTDWQTFIVRTEELADRQSLAPVRAWIRMIAQTYKDPGKLIGKACESLGLKDGVDAVTHLFLSPSLEQVDASKLPWNDAKTFFYFTSALLHRMVRFAMKQGPVLLAVDDFDVEDQAAVNLVDALLTNIAKQPVLVALSRRVESAALDHGLPGNFDVLTVREFAPEEALQYMNQALGYQPPQDVAETLYERSSGNPLFLAEMVRSLGALSQTQVLDAQRLEAALPLSLHELLGQRVDDLSDNLRDLLAIASVLGDTFQEQFYYQITPAHLAPQLGIQHLVALNMLEARADMFGRVQIAFQPRALRQIIYDRLPLETRVQFHQQVITFLEQAPDAAAVDHLEWPRMLAFHYQQVSGLEGAAYYKGKTGEILLDLYDYDSAIEEFEGGLKLLKTANAPNNNVTFIGIVAKLLLALRESGRLEEADSYLSRLPEDDAIPPEILPDVLLERGRIGIETTIIEASYQSLYKLRDIAIDTRNTKLEITALLTLAELFQKEGQLNQAASILVEASKKVDGLEGINVHNAEDRRLYWTVYNQLGTLFIRQQNVQKARELLNTALRRAKDIEDHRGLVRILSNLGALCLAMRDVPTAKEYFGNAVQFAQATGDLLNQARILTNLGIALMEANDYEGSKRYFKQARTLAEEIGWYEGLADLSLHIKKLRGLMGA